LQKRVRLDIRDKKAFLRKHFKTLRELLSEEKWKIYSQVICNLLLRSDYYQVSKSIAFYMAINREVDLSLAFNQALKEKEVFLPRTDTKQRTLYFHRVKSLAELRVGAFSILEPSSEAPEISVKDLDLILVPALAFDLTKGRLGYGGGYYDRILRETKALKVGVAFSFQVVPELPLEPFDVRMDLLLTERGWL